jgi:hypothetical protein
VRFFPQLVSLLAGERISVSPVFLLTQARITAAAANSALAAKTINAESASTGNSRKTPPEILLETGPFCDFTITP